MNIELLRVKSQVNKSMEEFQPDDELKTILEKERAFEAQMSRVTRVQEDVLETVYLGDDE